MVAAFSRRIRTWIMCGQRVVVLVELLAVHAVDALVDIDLAVGVDRLNRAFLGTALAGRAAFGPALQPVEHAEPSGDRQRRAERAEVAAEEALDEETGHSHRSAKRRTASRGRTSG